MRQAGYCSHDEHPFVFQAMDEPRVCSMGLSAGYIGQCTEFFAPILDFQFHGFGNKVFLSDGCTEVCVTVSGDVDSLLGEQIFCLFTVFIFSDDPGFTRVWIIAIIWTKLVEFLPPGG